LLLQGCCPVAALGALLKYYS